MSNDQAGGSRLALLTVRAANAVSRVTYLGAHFLNDVPLVLYSPGLAVRLSEHFYARHTEYLDDSHTLRGLFPFEQEVLDRHFPKPPARLLLHAAGFGREAIALARLGYRVDAYEPVPACVDAATRLLGDLGLDATVGVASVESWAQQPPGEPYDGIVTGWGMWTHMMEHAGRVAALRAFRVACPDGPLLLSFFRSDPNIDETEWGVTPEPLYPEDPGLRRVTRRILRRGLLRKPPLERGTAWEGGTYVHVVAEPEIVEEAAAAGYRVAYYEKDLTRYGYAVLLPVA